MTPTRRNSTVRLDEDLFVGMDAVRERDGVEPSEQIRRALRAWLEEKGVIKAERKRPVSRKRP